MHAVELEVAAKEPAVHCMHADRPTVLYSPGLHVYWTRALLEKEPGEARMHDVWPVAGW